MNDKCMPPLRLVIADEQPQFLQSLRESLESDLAFRVVGEASSARRAIDLTRQTNPDVLLVDLPLFRAFQRHAATLPDPSAVPAAVMIAAIEKQDVVEALRLGARGVVPKTSTPQVLLKSIRRVVNNHYSLDNDSLAILVETVRDLLSGSQNGKSPKDFGLTRRELDIITKIANGRSNREVGQEFSISERTVKHHVTNIFGKIGVSSRLQLALFAVNHHLTANSEQLSRLPLDSDS